MKFKVLLILFLMVSSSLHSVVFNLEGVNNQSHASYDVIIKVWNCEKKIWEITSCSSVAGKENKTIDTNFFSLFKEIEKEAYPQYLGYCDESNSALFCAKILIMNEDQVIKKYTFALNCGGPIWEMKVGSTIGSAHWCIFEWDQNFHRNYPISDIYESEYNSIAPIGCMLKIDDERGIHLGLWGKLI